MANIVGRRCAGCGLSVEADSLPMNGSLFHRSCALDEPASQEASDDRTHRSLLKRIAHWANSVGWAQA